MKCMACGAENRPDALFCEICGEELSVDPDVTHDHAGECPACFHINRPDAYYCEMCGEDLAGGYVYENIDPQETFVYSGYYDKGRCPVCGAKTRPDAVYCSYCGCEFFK